ncbi:MAG: RluA family pseudouridine synthase [Myxococcota bacterium]
MSTGGWTEVELVVESAYAGWRLDRYLVAKLGHLSRTRVQRILATSLVSELALKSSTRVWPGLRFALRRAAVAEPPTPDTFGVLHLDDHLLVVDKPTGLPVHPSARYHHGTLVGLVRRRFGDGFAEPAHRLDRETSGVLACARGPVVARHLMHAFRRGEVVKDYLAVCEGWPSDEQFIVDAPIALGGAIVRIAVRIDREQGRPSRTRFVLLGRFEREGERFCVLHAMPETGRQHQIRVHLREAGLPIVGDKIYGASEMLYDRFTRGLLDPQDRARLRIERHALHAARLRLRHPATDLMLDVGAPLSPDLREFVGEALAYEVDGLVAGTAVSGAGQATRSHAPRAANTTPVSSTSEVASTGGATTAPMPLVPP